MPLSQLSLTTNLTWQLTRGNSGFANTRQGVDSRNFSLANLVLATFNQIYVAELAIASSGTQTIDLTSLTNLVYESFSLAHALTLLVLPTGSGVILTPGVSNGLTWFLSGTTPGITVHAGGLLLYSEPVAGPGRVVDSSHRTLTFSETGGAPLVLDLALVGSTT